MNAHARFNIGTEGFGAPTGIDPHCIEVHVPVGSSGQVTVVEHYGVAAGAFGRPQVERSALSRKTWLAIRDDVKRHFNERLKERNLPGSSWKAGINKVERLLGQELLVLAWAVEAADASFIAVAVRNWLALRPEERWWLYAVTASSTGEVRHQEVGWRKALRYALTENPVREALRKVEPEDGPAPRYRRRSRGDAGTQAPMLPGFEEEVSPFLTGTRVSGAHEELDAPTVFAEGRAVADRARDPHPENLSGGRKGTRRKAVADPDAAGRLLEGPKATRSKQGVRSRGATSRKRRS